jgi:acyl carrier protein
MMRMASVARTDRRQKLRDKVSALLDACDVELPDGPRESAPWIDSGKLDSLSLFKLALFVENEVGRTIDVGSFDLAKEWNTIDDIVHFIATQQAAA